jgi:hypothetical protein
MTIAIELHHETDPRYLIVETLPERVTIEDLSTWRYGKALLFSPSDDVVVYSQPGGPGTDWIKPT